MHFFIFFELWDYFVYIVIFKKFAMSISVTFIDNREKKSKWKFKIGDNGAKQIRKYILIKLNNSKEKNNKCDPRNIKEMNNGAGDESECLWTYFPFIKIKNVSLVIRSVPLPRNPHPEKKTFFFPVRSIHLHVIHKPNVEYNDP